MQKHLSRARLDELYIYKIVIGAKCHVIRRLCGLDLYSETLFRNARVVITIHIRSRISIKTTRGFFLSFFICFCFIYFASVDVLSVILINCIVPIRVCGKVAGGG